MSQVDTHLVSDEKIMRSRAFNEGVADVRQGRAPRFDLDDWNYERGRQWAVVAPTCMPVKIGRSINRKALLIFMETPIC